jgi:hypothetical protein
MKRQNAQERLRRAIDERQSRLRVEVPSARQAAILALISTLDQLPDSSSIEPLPDLVTGRRLANLGGNKALQLCVESTGDDVAAAPALSGDGLDGGALS